MTEKSKKFLSDILMAIDLIEDFTLGFDFYTYDKDSKTQSAVERKLAIIGGFKSVQKSRIDNLN